MAKCRNVFLLSMITWVPGLLIFFFQASMSGAGWLWANLWMAGSIFLASMAWIILLSLIALAISAVVKWRVVASGAMLGLFFVPSAFGGIVMRSSDKAGNLISLSAAMAVFGAGFWLFDERPSIWQVLAVRRQSGGHCMLAARWSRAGFASYAFSALDPPRKGGP